MPKSITRTAIAAASKATFTPGLKSLGFRRQANQLWRSSNGLVHGVQFQGSQWGTAREGSFAVNLIVTSAWLWKCWTGCPLPSNPATAGAPIQQRLGMLIHGGRDYWWEVSEATG